MRLSFVTSGSRWSRDSPREHRSIWHLSVLTLLMIEAAIDRVTTRASLAGIAIDTQLNEKVMSETNEVLTSPIHHRWHSVSNGTRPVKPQDGWPPRPPGPPPAAPPAATGASCETRMNPKAIFPSTNQLIKW